ncbi:MAG: hypothetical protein WAU34_04140, partial [Desulfobacterales bacterium]
PTPHMTRHNSGFRPLATGQSFDVGLTAVSNRQGGGAATVQPYSPHRTAVDRNFFGSSSA